MAAYMSAEQERVVAWRPAEASTRSCPRSRGGPGSLEEESVALHRRAPRSLVLVGSWPPPLAPTQAPAGLRRPLQRQGPLRLEGARGRQRPLEGRRRRHRLRRQSEAEGRQEPLDRAASTATSSCAWTGGSRRRPYMNPNVPIILPDGTHKKGADGKEIQTSVPDSDSGIYPARRRRKAQVNIWCWPIGSGEVYGYRMDETMPAEVRAGVTPEDAGRPRLGEWNTFEITMKGDRLTVVLNGKSRHRERAAARHPARGPIGLQHHGDMQGREVGGPARPRPVPEHLRQGAEVRLRLDRVSPAVTRCGRRSRRRS